MQFECVQQFIIHSGRMAPEELTLVKGVFEDSLPHFSKDGLVENGAPLVIHIDCDLYSSTREVLRFIDDLITTGTWVLFDDYWCYRGSPDSGEQRALREWLNNHERIGLQPYCNFEGWGRAFIAYEK